MLIGMKILTKKVKLVLTHFVPGPFKLRLDQQKII